MALVSCMRRAVFPADAGCGRPAVARRRRRQPSHGPTHHVPAPDRRCDPAVFTSGLRVGRRRALGTGAGGPAAARWRRPALAARLARPGGPPRAANRPGRTPPGAPGASAGPEWPFAQAHGARQDGAGVAPGDGRPALVCAGHARPAAGPDRAPAASAAPAGAPALQPQNCTGAGAAPASARFKHRVFQRPRRALSTRRCCRQKTHPADPPCCTRPACRACRRCPGCASSAGRCDRLA